MDVKCLKERIRCIWEHNGNDTLLWSVDYPGAYTRGETKMIAVSKMKGEIESYAMWASMRIPNISKIDIIDEVSSDLKICDADSDVLFEQEKNPLTVGEYKRIKALTLKSASDFLNLYTSIPDKFTSKASLRKTFYGKVPRTAEEMYQHTKNVNSYYFNEIGVEIDNNGDILECRLRGFEELEKKNDFLLTGPSVGSYGEIWSLNKVLRRFIWHDRIHAKAMYRMALSIWGDKLIKNIFMF